MKVFITGATGLVGSFICRELLNKGYQVRAIKRETSNFDLLEDIQDQIEWVDGEIGHAIFWENYLEGIDAVIHAAAIISFDKRWEKRMYETNVLGTADLVNAMLKSEVRNMLHVSSIAAIGRQLGQKSLNENDRWEGNSFDSIYARSKYFQELEVWRGAEEGLNVKIINPSTVLGPGQWSDFGSTSIFKYAYEQRSFCPSGSVNYVDVRDVAAISVSLLESDIKSERFIVNADSTSFLNLLGKISQRFGKKGPSKIAAPWMLNVAIFTNWIRAKITGKEALITKETAKIAMENFHYDNAKVRETLNFSFNELESTLDWASEELKKKYAL